MTEGHENVLARIADEAYERATTAIRLMLAAQADNRKLHAGVDTLIAERDALQQALEIAEAATLSIQKANDVLRAERDEYKAALLNTRGDDLCWISDADQAKALPCNTKG